MSLYNLAVAVPVPAVLIVLAFTKGRHLGTRIILVGSALVLFVVLLFVSLLFFCECE